MRYSKTLTIDSKNPIYDEILRLVDPMSFTEQTVQRHQQRREAVTLNWVEFSKAYNQMGVGDVFLFVKSGNRPTTIATSLRQRGLLPKVDCKTVTLPVTIDGDPVPNLWVGLIKKMADTEAREDRGRDSKDVAEHMLKPHTNSDT